MHRQNLYTYHMKYTLKTISIFFYFSTFWGVFLANAQSDYIKGRWSVQAGHSKYKDFGKKLYGKTLGMSDYRLAVNYGITTHLEMGIYGGIAQTANLAPLDSNFTGFLVYNSSPSFGIQAQYHLLPYWIKSNDFRFDLYVKGSFGFRKTKHRLSAENNGIFPEYAAGIGAAFYVLKNVGIYGDYTYGKFNTVRNSLQRSALRYGIVVKF